ncbi:MAG: hypothetical protein ACYC1U_09635 [Candidatus Aquicultorales bacterium]
MLNKRTLIIIGVIAVVLLVPSVVMGMGGGMQGLQSTLYRGFYRITFVEDSPSRLQELHMNNKPGEANSRGCIACHGDMKDKRYPVHYKMLQPRYMTFSCTDCHPNVDVRSHRPGAATVQVDRKLCAECHNPPVLSGTAAESQAEIGRKFAKSMPSLLVQHGNDAASALKWVSEHPSVAMAMGIETCRECHIPGSELDFCNVCHLRGGSMPKSHRPMYTMAVNLIHPNSVRTAEVSTQWRGYHFVLVRDALEKMGVENVTPEQLPKAKIDKLPCGACHDVKTWCNKCHVKHAEDWLNPVKGHPVYVAKYGQEYCYSCHDKTKCLSCHTYVGQVNGSEQ